MTLRTNHFLAITFSFRLFWLRTAIILKNCKTILWCYTVLWSITLQACNYFQKTLELLGSYLSYYELNSNHYDVFWKMAVQKKPWKACVRGNLLPSLQLFLHCLLKFQKHLFSTILEDCFYLFILVFSILFTLFYVMLGFTKSNHC